MAEEPRQPAPHARLRIRGPPRAPACSPGRGRRSGSPGHTTTGLRPRGPTAGPTSCRCGVVVGRTPCGSAAGCAPARPGTWPGPRCAITTDDPAGAGRAGGQCRPRSGRGRHPGLRRAAGRQVRDRLRVDFFDPDVNGTYRVAPTWAFGLVESDFEGSPTRWDFAPARSAVTATMTGTRRKGPPRGPRTPRPAAPAACCRPGAGPTPTGIQPPTAPAISPPMWPPMEIPGSQR